MSLAVAKALLESEKDLDKLSEITANCQEYIFTITAAAADVS